MDTLAVVLLALLAVTLTVFAPRVMVPRASFRSCPGPALLVWQCVSLAGIMSALLGRLLLSAQRVGTGLRALRRRHRDLVSVLGRIDPHTSVTVLDHASPTAYCLPGADPRIVLTAGAVAALDADEMKAVLAHERAHLVARHDVILEFFTVLHHAVPGPIRCEAALSEVHLLVEALADRAALRLIDARSLARALVTMHTAAYPEATLGAGGTVEQTTARLLLIADAAHPRNGRAVGMICSAVGVFLLPFVLASLGV